MCVFYRTVSPMKLTLILQEDEIVKSPSEYFFFSWTFSCLIALRLVAEISFSSENRFWYWSAALIRQFTYDIQLSVLFRSLVSISCCQFHLSNSFTFIPCSFLGLLSQSRLRLWIALGWIHKTAYMRVTHTALYLYISLQVSSSVRACSMYSYSLETNAWPGLSLRIQLADDRFFVSNSQQHLLTGTPQCAQVLISVCAILGAYWEYWEYTF